MKYYNSYMDRQEISRETHKRLLDLKVQRRPGRPWVRYGAMAACAALIVGLGLWRLAPAPNPAPASRSVDQFTAGYTPLPGESGRAAAEPEYSFVVSSPTKGKLLDSTVPNINYSNSLPNRVDMAIDRVFPPGAFTVDLTKEDIQTIFWGPEGMARPSRQDDLPWMLLWDGYTVRGSARYDGQGQLMELTISGERGSVEPLQADFKLELCPGSLPFNCAIDMYREDELSQLNGVSLAGWSASETFEKDGETYIYAYCGSEFMTPDNIGIRFENWSRQTQTEGGGDDDVELNRAKTFNALFVRQALTDGLYLGQLMLAEYVPAWREESFTSLAQARQEAEFAPYLPTREPEGFASRAGDKEFHGFVSYQEGIENRLVVRWSWEDYDVEVVVHRDGDGSYRDAYDYYRDHLVDADNPASYDVRLYEGPGFTPVPEEYWNTLFVCAAFRAEDMSLAIVEARGRQDTFSGLKFCFDVVHPDGTVVSYSCTGVTAQELWEMVEETL